MGMIQSVLLVVAPLQDFCLYVIRIYFRVIFFGLGKEFIRYKFKGSKECVIEAFSRTQTVAVISKGRFVQVIETK